MLIMYILSALVYYCVSCIGFANCLLLNDTPQDVLAIPIYHPQLSADYSPQLVPCYLTVLNFLAHWFIGFLELEIFQMRTWVSGLLSLMFWTMDSLGLP